MAGPLAEVENAVKRPHWEPRHEWESRVKFVEDNVADYGLEKAISLSIVWANMKFLGCSYPPGTERQVSSYPLPPLEELKARRKAKQSLKRGLSGGESPKRIKLDDTISDVSSLISSIRSQSENQQSSGVFFLEYDETLSKKVPRSIQVVANKVCLCKDCIGCDGVNERAMRLMQKYADSEDSSFRFEFNEETVPQAFGPEDGYKCTLLINGELVIEKLVAHKKDSKSYVSTALLKMADDWQEAHGKPACPNLNQSADSQQQCADEYHSTYNNTPSRNTYNRGRGNMYDQRRGNTYNQGRGNTYNRGHGNTYKQGHGNTYSHRWGDHYPRQSQSQDGSRYNTQDYFMPPPQSARRSGHGNSGGQGYGGYGNSGGHGYGGRGNSGGSYQYGSPRYY